MIDLPNRGDTTYKEIKEFKDYEFTNCIAYEMVIRNNKVIELIKRFLEKFINVDLNAKDIFYNTSSLKESFKESQELINIYCINPIYLHLEYGFLKNVTDELQRILQELKVTNEGKYRNLNSIFFNKNREYEETRTPEDYKQETQLMGRDNPEENKYTHFKSTNTYQSLIIYKEIKVKDTKDLLYKEDLKKLNKDDFVKTISNEWIKPNYSRPELHQSFMSAKKRSVEIDFSLPLEEITDFIKILKKEHKDEEIIKNPLELLGMDFEKSNNKKMNKKLIADKFFIYDYVASRLKQIKEDNLLMYEEYEEQKQEILNNKYIDSNDRKIQLKELKREFEENTNVRKDEVFEDIEGFSSGTAKRYYYDIKPFIDDCKYKELITGTTTK